MFGWSYLKGDYASEEDAKRELFDYLDSLYENYDNYRFAYEDDHEGMGLYEDRKENGCCGSMDLCITINGRPAMMGCNYGH